MRVGCLGCLTLVLTLGGISELGWIGLQALREPEFELPATAPGDGIRAQRKVYQIAQVARRGPGRSAPGGEPIVLTQGELNAFLSRHLVEAAELPFADLALRLTGDAGVEFRGRLPLAQLLTEPPLSGLGRVLPASLFPALEVLGRPRPARGIARAPRVAPNTRARPRRAKHHTTGAAVPPAGRPRVRGGAATPSGRAAPDPPRPPDAGRPSLATTGFDRGHHDRAWPGRDPARLVAST